MAKLFLLLLFVGVYLRLSASTSIECDYLTQSWNILTNVYYCQVNKDPSITTKESATITSISGIQKSGKTNSDVEGFDVYSKTCHFFPHGLESFFENIKLFRIYSCNLKEVHQEDLKPFPKLVELALYYNSLEVLEDGLFDFNPNLEYVHFQSNKIVHIESRIFDHLSKLSFLWLSSNTCIDLTAQNSISQVKNLVQIANSQCINSEFSSLKENLENLEKEAIIFTEKLLTFGQTLNSTKFASFRPLNYKFAALKELNFGKTSFKASNSAPTTSQVNTDCLNQVLENHKNLLSSQDNVKSSLKDLNSALNVTNTHFCSSIQTLETSSNQHTEAILNSLKSTKTDILGSIDYVCAKESFKDILNSSISKVNTNIDALKTSTSQRLTELNLYINTNHKKSQNLFKSSQDDIKSSIDDIEATLNSLKSSQTDIKSSMNKIKSSQYEMKATVDELRIQKDDDADDKFKIIFDEIEILKGQISGIKADIVKEVSSSRHRITAIIDEKIKGIEKRLMKKFEEILENKLAKFIGN